MMNEKNILAKNLAPSSGSAKDSQLSFLSFFLLEMFFKTLNQNKYVLHPKVLQWLGGPQR
jgi:hypothetical protein